MLNRRIRVKKYFYKRYQRIHHFKVQILVHNETALGWKLQHILIIQDINVQNVEVQLYIIVLRALAFNASTSAKAIYSTFILGSYYFK